MLSRSVVAMLALGMAPAAVAQRAAAPHDELGLLFGPNFTTLNGATAAGVRHWTNSTMGVRWTWRAGRRWGVEPELLFSQFGAGHDVDAITTDYTRTSYLQLPVLLRFDLRAAGLVRPYLFAGPSGSYRIGCRAGEVLAGEHIGHPCSATNEVRRLDLGGLGGVGVAIGRVDVGARYYLGLKNIDPVQGADLKNRGLTVTAGFALWR